MAENVPKLVKGINLQTQEAGGTSNKINPKKFMPRHMVITFMIIRDKEKLLKAEKNNTLPVWEHQFK